MQINSQMTSGRIRKGRRQLAGALAWLALIPLVGATANEADAVRKLQAAVELAWQRGPDLALVRSEIEQSRALARSERRAGAPYVEYQEEGIGPSLANRPNAARYLRFGSPFNAPWQRSAGRALEEGTISWGSAHRRAAALEIAVDVSDAWLEAAALQERAAIRERRLERLARAVALQSKRLEVGEVSGADLVQIELERARAELAARSAQAELEAVRAHLTRLTGAPAPAPARGDLTALAAVLEPLPASESWLDAAVDSSAAVVAALHGTERERCAARLERVTAEGRPEAQLEWEKIPYLDGADGFEAIGVVLHWPLPIGKAVRARRAAGRARVRAAEQREQRVRAQTRADLQAAVAEARQAAASLELHSAMIEKLNTSEHVLAEQFRLGASSYLEFLDGSARLDEVRLLHVDTLRSLLGARLDLAAITGDRNLFPLPAQAPEVTP
ncbi:MAG: TolC family protein [Acidobacteriota bacterium]|nr:MAG: TolC family protein [Acidobacteriota bacterium]